MLTNKSILEQKAPGYIDALAHSQRSKGLRDTGYSAEHTRFTITVAPESITLALIGPAYWKAQQYGRGPNRSRKPSREMVRRLKAWAVRHGMDEGAGYPIARKIAMEGIQVPNPHNPGGVISEPLSPVAIAKDLGSSLRPLIKQNIKAFLFS